MHCAEILKSGWDGFGEDMVSWIYYSIVLETNDGVTFLFFGG